MKKIKYTGKMDKECIPLCDAINSIPGLETTESCCGHHEDHFRIWFKVLKFRNLYVLVRNIDIRYGAPSGWTCEIQDTDLPEDPLIFIVSSNKMHLADSYRESLIIVKGIKDFLENKKFMKMFGIK